MYLALFAQEPQGGGGQGGAPGGAIGAGGGQSAPAGDVGGRGDQGAPGGAGEARGGGQGGARGGGPPRGGGPGFKNVQVLNPATIPDTMQSFVQALGLLDKGTCTYCHVEDRSSDEKRPKVIARRMVTMMRAINGTFPAGQPHVTCYTCHRGSTTPITEPAP